MINYFTKIGKNGEYLTDWPTNNILKRITKDIIYIIGKHYANKLKIENEVTKNKIKSLKNGECEQVNNFKVSIVIPAFNAESFIQDTIDACRKQTHKNIEIIIVDDESTDTTPNIVSENPDVVLLKQKNSGPGIARNFGVSKATGDFIFFLDADDYVPANAIESLLLCCHNFNADFAVGKTLRKHLDQKHMAYYWMPQNYTNFRISNLTSEINLFKDTNVHNRIYRSSFWRENNFKFENCLYEDKLLSFDIWRFAKDVAILDDFTYQWNVRGKGSSITNSKDLQNISNRIYVINKLLNKELPNILRKELEQFTIEQDLKVSVEHWNDYYTDVQTYIFEQFKIIVNGFEHSHKFADENLDMLYKNIKKDDFSAFKKQLL